MSAALAQEDEILLVLEQALSALDLHDARVVIALADLGDIELPEGSSLAGQAERLAPLGPFYLAYQLEQAGFLRTAELVAGLFASGAITAALDTAGPLITKFWRERHQRLSEAERLHLFETVFESPYSDRLLERLMRSISALADNAGVTDIREDVALEQSGLELADYLGNRAGGMVAFAARDITTAINDALRFLKDRALLAAFAVHSLWDLVQTTSDGQAAVPVHTRVDMGKSGQSVLLWLANSARTGTIRLDPASDGFRNLAAAAMTWLQAYDSLSSLRRPSAQLTES